MSSNLIQNDTLPDARATERQLSLDSGTSGRKHLHTQNNYIPKVALVFVYYNQIRKQET